MALKRIATSVSIGAVLAALLSGTALAASTPLGDPNLGERVDSPYMPYTFRAGDYNPQDYEGIPTWEPNWLMYRYRYRSDGRRPATMQPGTVWFDPECPCYRVSGYNRPLFSLPEPDESVFYRNAMGRSAGAFGSVEPVHTYGNFQYRFENQLRSIR